MRMSSKVEFNSKQAEVVREFAKQMGLTVDVFVKQAVFFTINESYRRAEQEKKQNESSIRNDTVSPVSEGISTGTSGSEDPSSSTLPDQNTNAPEIATV